MSAYVVEPTHVDALLSIALHGSSEGRAPWLKWRPQWVEIGGEEDRGGSLTAEMASRVGAELLAECIESVAYRYPDSDRSDLPGPIPTPDPDQYEFTDLGRVFSLGECLQAISGYEYQACEHPGWRVSYAYRFCAELRSNLVSHLRGEADTWEVTADRAAALLSV